MFQSIKAFVTKYANAFCLLILALFCYLFLFHGLGNYRLIDIDETRYINIARVMLAKNNWITPYLNHETFLEKPPLFYWLVALSYKLFGVINEFTSRFSVAALSAFSIFATYFFAKKAMNSKIYAMISSLILLTSVWFLLFSHIAILDMGLMVFTMATIYCAVLTLFDVQDKNKKFLWWASYLFMGLAVLQKGLPGIIIPAIVILPTFFVHKKIKEIFSPINILPGLLVFLIVTLPWHIAVFQANGMLWFNDYIIKQHFARFMDSSMGLGRKQPFLFYVPIVLAGFIPWIFSFLAACAKGVKSAFRDIRATKTIRPLFSTDTRDRSVMLFSAIYLILPFLFFSISSTKLPTYILVIFPALALITGYLWWGYISDNKFERAIKISSIVAITVFVTVGLVGGVITNFLHDADLVYVNQAMSFRMLACSWFIILPLISALCLYAKNRSLLFISNIIFMLGIIIIATGKVFGFVSEFGQNELEDYANKARMVSGARFVTLGFARKYSVLNIYNGKVDYIQGTEHQDYAALDEVLSKAKKDKVPVYIVTKNKIEYSPNRIKKFEKIENGERYSLYLYK